MPSYLFLNQVTPYVRIVLYALYSGIEDNVCVFLVREELKDLTKQYDKSENDLKALQSVGQIVGEVLKQLTEEKCNLYLITI